MRNVPVSYIIKGLDRLCLRSEPEPQTLEVSMVTQDSTLVLFGKTALHRTKCPECGDDCLIVENRTLCCDASVKPSAIEVKREVEADCVTRRFSTRDKAKARKRQHDLCAYCGSKLGVTLQWNSKSCRHVETRINYDHFIPLVYSGNNHSTNLIAACSICNSIKADRMFDTIAAARDHIRSRRQRKGFTVSNIDHVNLLVVI